MHVSKIEVFPKRICHQNWNVTKTEMSLNIKCHKNWNGTKNEMLPKLKYHENLNVTKTKISPKLICHQDWNVTKSEMSPNLWRSSAIFSYLCCSLLIFGDLRRSLVIFGGWTCPVHDGNCPKYDWMWWWWWWCWRWIKWDGLMTVWTLFNRPGVAGAVLQSPPSLINWLIEWSFSQNIFQTH